MRLRNLSFGAKLSLTFFLFIFIAGAMISAMLVNHSLNEESYFSPPSIQYIKAKYSFPPLKRSVMTNMKEYLENEEEQNIIINWCDSGAKRDVFYTEVEPVIKNRCIQCHGEGSTRGDISLLNWSDIAPLSLENGVETEKLMKQTHYHSFGIGALVLFVSLIFCATSYSKRIKIIAISISFSSMIIDLSSWWLCRVSEHFAWSIWFFGGIMVMSLVLLPMMSLRDMWQK